MAASMSAATKSEDLRSYGTAEPGNLLNFMRFLCRMDQMDPDFLSATSFDAAETPSWSDKEAPKYVLRAR